MDISQRRISKPKDAFDESFPVYIHQDISEKCIGAIYNCDVGGSSGGLCWVPG